MISYALGKAQKRSKKTLSLHLRLILGIQTAYNIQKNKNNNKQKKGNPEEVEGRGNVISRVTTLDLNVQCSTKNHEAYKETRKYGLFKEKKN